MTANLNRRFKERVALLAIAYYNLGCELEHLNQLEDCLEAYQRAKGLQVGRYGHQTIEAQFIVALKQVKQRIREQDLQQRGISGGKVKGTKSP